MHNRLSKGQELRNPHTDLPIWTVVNAVPLDGRIKLYSHASRSDEYVELREIKDQIIDHKIVVYQHGQARVELVDQDSPELIKKLQAATKHLSAIDEVQQRLGVRTSRAWEIVLDEHIKAGGCAEEFKSLSSTYRYLDRRREGLALIRGDANKGNRTDRYSDELTELAIEVIEEEYLKEGSQYDRLDLLTLINDEAALKGLLPVGKKIGPKFLKSLINEIAVDDEVLRMDPKMVPAAKSIGSKRFRVSLPFERYEQDAVHLPFVAKTPFGVSSDIWLVHTIDCGTSMVVGWKLVVGKPRESDTLRCAERFLFPKNEILRAHGVETTWDCEGIPMLLIFDNGPENKGDRILQLTRLRMGVYHCKSRHAHGKPFIERLNRSLKRGLQRIPGCTRMNGVDGKRDPVKLGDKLLTIEELEKFIVDWYYNVWANHPLKRLARKHWDEDRDLGVTPQSRWQKLVDRDGMCTPLPPSKEDWRKILYTKETGTLSRKTGIYYKKMHYKGANLPYLINQYSESELTFYVDRDDYRYIYVYDGDRKPLVPLVEEFVSDDEPAHSFDDIARIRSEQDALLVEGPQAAEFRQRVTQLRQRAPEPPEPREDRKKKSKAQINRDVALDVRKSDAIQRAKNKPHRDVVGENRAVSTDPRPAKNSEPVIKWDEVPSLPVNQARNGKKA